MTGKTGRIVAGIVVAVLALLGVVTAGASSLAQEAQPPGVTGAQDAPVTAVVLLALFATRSSPADVGPPPEQPGSSISLCYPTCGRRMANPPSYEDITLDQTAFAERPRSSVVLPAGRRGESIPN